MQPLQWRLILLKGFMVVSLTNQFADNDVSLTRLTDHNGVDKCCLLVSCQRNVLSANPLVSETFKSAEITLLTSDYYYYYILKMY